MRDLAAHVRHLVDGFLKALLLDAESPVRDIRQRVIWKIDADILAREGSGPLLRIGEAARKRVRPGSADWRRERKTRRSERDEVRDECAGTEVGRGRVQTVVGCIENRTPVRITVFEFNCNARPTRGPKVL